VLAFEQYMAYSMESLIDTTWQ